MLGNFRKAFKPTQEEIEQSQKLVADYIAKREMFLTEKGLSHEEMTILEELDGKEAKSVRTFQSYCSRYDQLRYGWITVEQVKEDIKKHKEDTP
jgi:tellurite resistance protein